MAVSGRYRTFLLQAVSYQRVRQINFFEKNRKKVAGGDFF
jgi:hypothetical protein